jgi:hypothetical protein
MKLFIPLNSNDYNGICSTLSIAPVNFYSIRGYGFLRRSKSYFFTDKDIIVATSTPVFHNQKYDDCEDYGYPIFVEINSQKYPNYEPSNEDNIFFYKNSIFLCDEFTIHFRNESEQKETFIKSVKCLEAKYSQIIESKTVSNQIKIDDKVKPIKIKCNEEVVVNSEIFYQERLKDKLLGISLASVISSISNKINFKLIDLIHKIENHIPTLISQDYPDSKQVILSLIEQVKDNYSKSIQQVIFERYSSESSSFFCEELLNEKPLNSNYKTWCELILNSLYEDKDLPFLVELYKLHDFVSNTSFLNLSTKTNEGIKHIYSIIGSMQRSLKYEFRELQSKSLILAQEIIVLDLHKKQFTNTDSSESFLLIDDKDCLLEILLFFVEEIHNQSIDSFLSNRLEILTKLATKIKNKTSIESKVTLEYLRNLYTAVKNKTATFDLCNAPNQVLKTIAVLFLYGRDLEQFINNSRDLGINSSFIYLSLWASIFGAASLPKTLLDAFFISEENRNSFMEVFKTLFSPNYNLDDNEVSDMSTDTQNNKNRLQLEIEYDF